jgi:ERCC4-type nuclease
MSTLNLVNLKYHESMNNHAILADCRETKVIPFFPPGILNIKQIVCGDFQIWKKDLDTSKSEVSNEQPIAVIERKTWQDLASSIIDGRADSQHHRMLEFSKKTGAKVYYMIEGPVFQQPSKRFTRSHLTFSSLIKRLDHWTFNYNIIVTHTRNPEDTARRIMELVANISGKKNTPITLTGSPLWKAISSLSISATLQKIFSLPEILSMQPSSENINNLVSKLRENGARCGKKTASKILNPDTVRLLNTIRGISKQRAILIGTQFPNCLQEIASGSPETLLAICEIEGIKRDKTIGKKIHSAIFFDE